MNKEIKSFLKNDTPDSMMRLSMYKAVNTAIFIGGCITIGAVFGFIVSIFKGNDLSLVAACIGALAGLGGALVSSFLIPAFTGKAAQAKFENENKTDSNSDTNTINKEQ